VSEPLAFYSCLDTTCARVAPQAVQHLVIADFVSKLGGRVSFYTTESPYSGETHEVILGKAKEKPKVAGFVFYRLAQFLSAKGPHIAALTELLAAGYSVHFAVEKVSLRAQADLDAFFPMLSAIAHTETRDAGRDYFDGLLAGL
jgi:hypothetical protein